jgi:cell division protein FtsB
VPAQPTRRTPTNPIPINVWVVLSDRVWYLARIGMRAATVPTSISDTPAMPRRQQRRFWSQALLFTACVLLVNAVFGERGLTDTIRARRDFAAASNDLARIKRENAALREEARRLRSDPAAIEAVARGELGLVKPGEILVTVKDVGRIE